MPQGKYYSLMLSKHISKTPEGYLICHNVPLCRSGYQEYKGKELVGFDGYDPEWGLQPEGRYQVYRPPEEVTHPDFIASLEGKSVTDEHPEGNVVHIDNEEEVNRGHVQNVKKGPEVDGEVTLEGDLVIKHPDLIDKIRPDSDPENEYGTATRQVSVGYGLKLGRLENGTIVMRRLRGNHTAVVEKGRAGPQFAIKDSALPEIITEKKETPVAKLWDLILGRGVDATFPDASPEQKASIIAEFPAGSLAADSKLAPKNAGDSEGVHPAHETLEKLLHAKEAGDSAACATHMSELFKHIGHEEPHHASDEELEQEEETPAEEHDEEHATDSEHAEKQIDDPGESVLKAANDSVRNYIKVTRPFAAAAIVKPRSKRTNDEQVLIDSYNGAVKSLNTVGKNAYKIFTAVKTPEGIPAVGAVATDAKPAEPCTCFDGVAYAIGAKKHRETCLKEKK